MNRIKRKIREIKLYRELPERIVILLTNPRSGSTWLLDALRCHPCISMLSSATIFEIFNLDGRRYPLDLSSVDSGVNLEVQVGTWEKIPRFDIYNSTELLPECPSDKIFTIEKIHPHFFQNDEDNFLQCIKKIEKKTTVRIVYLVRDPKQSMYSFFRYQERNPNWNSHRKRHEIPPHMRKIYESLLRTARIHPGITIDYNALINDFHVTIERIFDYLWPGEHISNTGLINRIFEETVRDSRVMTGTPFLDKNRSNDNLDLERYLYSEHAEEMDLCYRAYNQLLQLVP